MPREVNSLQVILDKCAHAVKKTASAATCENFPDSDAVNALTSALSIVHKLCEIIGFNPDELMDSDVPRKEPVLDLDDVALPQAFHDALDAAVADTETEATRRSVGSKAQWGRCLAKWAVAQAHYHRLVGARILKGSRSRQASGTDIPQLAGVAGNPTRKTNAPNPQVPRKAEGVSLPVGGNGIVDVLPASLPPGSSLTGDAAPAKGRPLDSESSLATVQSLGLSGDHISAHNEQERGDVPASATVAPDVTAALAPALFRTELPFETSFDTMSPATYGDGSRGGSRDHGIAPIAQMSDTDQILRRLIDQTAGTKPRFDILDADERGYSATPLDLQQMREIVHLTMGRVAIGQSMTQDEAEPDAWCFAPARVERLDIQAAFRKIFGGVLDETYSKLFTLGATPIESVGGLEALKQHATGSFEGIPVIGADRSKALNPQLLKELLLPQTGTLSITTELSPGSRKAARILANKKVIPQWYKQPIDVTNNTDIGKSINVFSLLGPAGSGKTTALNAIYQFDDAHQKLYFPYKPKYPGDDVVPSDYYSNVICQIIDFSRPGAVIALQRYINFAKRESTNRKLLCLVIEECTFFPVQQLELLSCFDQVIFAGDPRQMGSVDSSAAIMNFVKLAGGENRVLGLVFRRLNPQLFDTLNYLAYDGLFELADRINLDRTSQFHITTCHDDVFCTATSMLLAAMYHVAEKRKVYIATQNIMIVDYINSLIRLDPAAYKDLVTGVLVVPLSHIQGHEVDVLVINPAEVDQYCTDVVAAMKYVFVVLGRVRHSLSVVQPIRKAVALQSRPPLFSFFLHALLGESIVRKESARDAHS